MERFFSDTNFISDAGDHPFPPHSPKFSFTSLLNGTDDNFDYADDVKPLSILPPNSIPSSLPLFPPSTDLFSDFLLFPPPLYSATADSLPLSHELVLSSTTNYTGPNSALDYNFSHFINPLPVPVSHPSSYSTPMFHLPNLCYQQKLPHHHPLPSALSEPSQNLPRLIDSHPVSTLPSSRSITLDSILAGFDLSMFVASLTAANSLLIAPKKETHITVDNSNTVPTNTFPLPSLPPLTLTHGRAHRTQGRRTITQMLRKCRSKAPSNFKRTLKQRIADKMHRLSMLLPVDKKLDYVTMLEEMFKYVKFLQAQVIALESMPFYAPSNYGSEIMGAAGSGRGLGRLSRKQVLQVLMNSQDVQRAMYSGGWVLVSAEQVAALWSRASPVFAGKELKI